MLAEQRSPWDPPEPTLTYSRAWKHWFALVKARRLGAFVSTKEWRDLLASEGILGRTTVHEHTKALEEAGLVSTVYGGFFLQMGYCNGITSSGFAPLGPDGKQRHLGPTVCEDYVDDEQWKVLWEPKASDELDRRMRDEYFAQSRRERATDALNGAFVFMGAAKPGERLTFNDFRVRLVVGEVASALDDEAARYEGYPSSLERARELAELACEMGLVRINDDLSLELLKPPRVTRDAPEPVPNKRRGIRNRSDRASFLV
jgi:hypothetical protein